MRLWFQIPILLGLIAEMALAQEVKLPAMSQLKESDSFRVAELTAIEQKQIFEEIEKISFDVPNSWESELRVRRVSLGGMEGLVLQGTSLLCGGTGNCETFVLRRENSKWIAMFQEEAPVADGIGFYPETSNGIKNLIVAANASAESEHYIIYKFDGQFYRASLCYEKSSADTKKVPCKKNNLGRKGSSLDEASSTVLNSAEANIQAQIRSTFVIPWVEALKSNDPVKLKKFLHPSVLACINDKTREYFDFSLAEQLGGAKGKYEITKLKPWNGPGPLLMFPADGFSYPSRPTYELNLQFEQTNLVQIRFLAPTNGKWYEVEPCPNEKGMALFREMIAKGNEQKKRAAELAAKLEDPLLGEVRAILKQHRLTDAAKRYQEATGLDDFSLAVMVMNIVDPEHPLGRP